MKKDVINSTTKASSKFVDPNCEQESELITPYFRKTINCKNSSNLDLAEEKINGYLQLKGIYFIEQSEEAVQLSRTQSSLKASISPIKDTDRLSDIGFNRNRLSDFDMNNNNLFKRRKLSNIRSSQDVN